ncbi:hypothetical protein AAE250_21310 [Bacteroides sp. GD17]|jgi:hypothetical protein|uniref:hypothetical protein n=1 Tax=Bacteroides sp. GD17 TaxID=3139826 RepID=UPI0025D53D9A|nr:hypothetical protein [uncultured Bacteroides sp.]
MSGLTLEILKKGYLLFPKVLFEEQMKMRTSKQAAGNFEAFVLVLTHVNYSTVSCRVKGHTFDCMRGESVLTMSHWMQIFGWNRNRTRYFFNKMFGCGIIERLLNPYVLHIRIPDYDLLTGNVRPQSAAPSSRPGTARTKDAPGQDFATFWQKYYDVTEYPKINIGRARREWKKLSPQEKLLAIERIDEYYDHLSNLKYCKQAASYLADKSYNDEYDD